MEDSSGAVIVPVDNKKNEANMNNNCLPKKKSRRVMRFLRIALYMLRRRSGAKPAATNVGLWKKLLGSMRSLHLQSNCNDRSPPPPLPSIMPLPNVVVVENIEAALTPPLSPAFPSSSSSVDGGMSQYASAVNLQELDRSDDEEEEDNDDEVYADGLGDAMIDEKAEEFIAHFYEQMRLQNMERANRTNWSLR